MDQLRLNLSCPKEDDNATVDLDNETRQHHFSPTTIIHGANDTTIPCQIGRDFHKALLQQISSQKDEQKLSFFVAPEVDLVVYESMTHTDSILENPFAGDQQLHKDIYQLCQKRCNGLDQEFDETIPSCQRVDP